MISDRNDICHNIIPGRLKSIVINEWLTISYAGISIQAIDTARELYRKHEITTEKAIKCLIRISERYCKDLDFILCSHEGEARLLKIADGQAFEGADAYWIGSSEAAAELSKIKVPYTSCEDLPDYISTEEMIFKSAFQEFMRENHCEGVGGAIIDCLCSPFGHCYNTHAGAFSWDTIILGNDDTVKREANKKTGMYHYEYNVCSTSTRGKAILGFYLGQSGIGFIYDPIHSDEAIKITGHNMMDFSRLVEHAGNILARASHNK